MLRIICEAWDCKRGAFRRLEDSFTDKEARTAVELARERQKLPNLYRNVRVLDEKLTSYVLLTVAPTDPENGVHEPVVLKSKNRKLPALVWLDLTKLPRPAKKAVAPKRLRVLGVDATVFDLVAPSSSKRVSKRQRAMLAK